MADFLIAHVGHTQKWDEHVCWWRPDSCGYTICIDKAGKYTEEQARAICEGSECMAVSVDAAAVLARTTPYYRQSNGTLAKLYDGGPHRPIENSAKAWTALKQCALVIGRYAKPTPITSSRARAIYPDGYDQSANGAAVKKGESE